MSENTRAVATTDGRDLAKLSLPEAIQEYTPHFQSALPSHIHVEHFKRMVLTAISTNPDLWSADRRTLFNACVKCASDGLLPDGREAALVVYRTKIKDRENREHWIDAVQYLPMIAGIRKRMRNSGEVASAEAYVVYKNDRFKYRLGDHGMIEHEPADLGDEPGEPVGAYAIIRLASDEVIREVMARKEIDRVRLFSRAKDGPAWTKSWGEMARKTVFRRAAKQVPQAAMLERLLSRDDETPSLPPVETMPLVPPRPRREDYIDPDTGEITDSLSDDEQLTDEELAAGDEIDGLPAHLMTPEEPAEEDADDGAGSEDPLGPYEGLPDQAPAANATAEPPPPAHSETLRDLLLALKNCDSRQKRDALALRRGRDIKGLAPDERKIWSNAYLAHQDKVPG